MSTPASFKKLSVVTISKDFKKATKTVSGRLPSKPDDDQVFVKVAYAGVNASDVNFTNGSYFKEQAPPFDCGFEAIGTVVAAGAAAASLGFSDGQVVGFSHFGSFAEYIAVPAASCVRMPDLKPEYLCLIVSGMTAAVALGEVGQPKKGEVALVTAAAGGTGHLAVQLLKHLYGCTVIGTCSSPDKVDFLKSIGCDHAINYKKEDLDARLKEIAPGGVHLVYESVGGETYNTAIRNMAVRGRLIVIGSISSYKSGEQVPFHDPVTNMPLASFLLVKSLSLRGFFLPHFLSQMPQYGKQLLELVKEGKMKLLVDPAPFVGLAAVSDAVDHLYSGKSCGKVIVKIQ